MIYKKIACCLLLFLPSCTSLTNTAQSTARPESLLKQHLVLLSDKKFENLPLSLKKKEIIFLGETHKDRPLAGAADRLAVYLAHHRPVVYAVESCYGLSPFMEEASLGSPKATKPMRIPECIQEFNFGQNANDKILMTAIDIEHSIYHTKSDTVLFLQDLADRSASEASVQAINKEIARLTAQDTYGKMNRYLKSFKKVFFRHFDTFSREDQDEIRFSMELLTASNRYQYANRGLIKSWQNPAEIRYRYFNKTIERAYAKARKNKAVLLCRVGSWHISMDHKCEARYFAKEYSLTKGNVATILLVPLYDDIQEPDDIVINGRGDIDTTVKVLMKDVKYAYLPLSELQKNTNSAFMASKYYSRSRPKYDSLLFIRIEK